MIFFLPLLANDVRRNGCSADLHAAVLEHGRRTVGHSHDTVLYKRQLAAIVITFYYLASTRAHFRDAPKDLARTVLNGD